MAQAQPSAARENRCRSGATAQNLFEPGEREGIRASAYACPAPRAVRSKGRSGVARGDDRDRAGGVVEHALADRPEQRPRVPPVLAHHHEVLSLRGEDEPGTTEPNVLSCRDPSTSTDARADSATSTWTGSPSMASPVASMPAAVIRSPAPDISCSATFRGSCSCAADTVTNTGNRPPPRRFPPRVQRPVAMPARGARSPASFDRSIGRHEHGAALSAAISCSRRRAKGQADGDFRLKRRAVARAIVRSWLVASAWALRRRT